MNDKTNGGPAFPTDYVKHVQQEVGNYVAITEHSPGMTLRDYFAAKAMQGMAAGDEAQGVVFQASYLELISRQAYQIADAMLAARSAG